MAEYSKLSSKRLITCHQDLIIIFHYAVQIFDNTIMSGYRSAEQQLELFKKGRTLVGGQWIIEHKNKVVTYKDGYKQKSNHQFGNAIDVVPYPGMWQSKDEQFFELAGVIKAIAFVLKKYGAISHDIQWGYDLWGWDMAHWQLVV